MNQFTNYAMEVLSNELQELQKARANLKNMFETVRSMEPYKDTTMEELRGELVSEYPLEEKRISDKIDSILEAMDYLMKRGEVS